MKEYILWVTTKYENGYSSRWYGWSSGLKFDYKEALKVKEEIKSDFHDVEIIEV